MNDSRKGGAKGVLSSWMVKCLTLPLSLNSQLLLSRALFANGN